MASSTQIAQVRRLIYGKSTGSGTLSTGDVAWFFDNNSNLYFAAAQAANAEQINNLANGRKKVGDLEVDYGSVAAYYGNLSAELRKQAVRKGGALPYSGGISVADKDRQITDSDWDMPESKRDQFSYSGGSESTTRGIWDG